MSETELEKVKRERDEAIHARERAAKIYMTAANPPTGMADALDKMEYEYREARRILEEHGRLP